MSFVQVMSWPDEFCAAVTFGVQVGGVVGKGDGAFAFQKEVPLPCLSLTGVVIHDKQTLVRQWIIGRLGGPHGVHRAAPDSRLYDEDRIGETRLETVARDSPCSTSGAGLLACRFHPPYNGG